MSMKYGVLISSNKELETKVETKKKALRGLKAKLRALETPQSPPVLTTVATQSEGGNAGHESMASDGLCVLSGGGGASSPVALLGAKGQGA